MTFPCRISPNAIVPKGMGYNPMGSSSPAYRKKNRRKTLLVLIFLLLIEPHEFFKGSIRVFFQVTGNQWFME